MPTSIREITCKTILTKTSGFLSGFTHTLQPYGGCVFRCPYCYVQALPVHLYHGGSWGSYVDVKINGPERLEKELISLHRRDKPVRVFMSSATDPYQGAEAKYCITRGCLEVFKQYQPELLVVQTRSPMVSRDFDLLHGIDRCILNLTVETHDENVRKVLTPHVPSIHHRIKTLDKAMAAGLTVQVAISPMLPNDPQTFAHLLKDRCHRVIVDTFFDGDGANGKRTEQLGIRTLFERNGYAKWYHPEAHRQLLETLQEVLGTNRVVFSKEGFNTA